MWKSRRNPIQPAVPPASFWVISRILCLLGEYARPFRCRSHHHVPETRQSLIKWTVARRVQHAPRPSMLPTGDGTDLELQPQYRQG